MGIVVSVFSFESFSIVHGKRLDSIDWKHVNASRAQITSSNLLVIVP